MKQIFVLAAMSTVFVMISLDNGPQIQQFQYDIPENTYLSSRLLF
jgi:hypothetical protein